MLLNLKTSPYLHCPLISRLRLRSLVSPSSSSLSYYSRRPVYSSLSTSPSPMDPTTTVEHVVLFKIRDPAATESMLTALRSLTSLNLASYLNAAPVLRRRSSAASPFTHLLHSRYPSKTSLAAYSAHPDHVAVVKNHVLPICDDILAVDWISDAPISSSPPSPGSAVRLTLAKPKEEAMTKEILEAIGGIDSSKMEQMSFGENFSPGRAKGYTAGFLSVFKSLEKMDKAMEDESAAVEAHKEKVRPLLDSVIVLDFLVPQEATDAASASL